MQNKKYSLLAFLLTAGLTVSVHAMDEVDQHIYDGIQTKHAPFFLELKNKASLFFTGKPSQALISQARDKIFNLNSLFHGRPRSKENLNSFQEKLNNTRTDLALLPDDLRNRIISFCFDSEAYDLVKFLRDPLLTEEFKPHYVADLRTPQQRFRHAAEAKKPFKFILNQQSQFMLKCGLAVAGCAAITGVVYYAYKKYCDWKKKKQATAQNNSCTMKNTHDAQ